MAINWLERVSSRGPNTASISNDGNSRAISTYVVANTGSTMLTERFGLIDGVLGWVETNENSRLSRGLPAAHPAFPFMYASRIASVMGIGKAATRQNAVTNIEVPSLTSTTASYPYYDVSIEFMTRPYALIPDSALLSDLRVYYDADGTQHTRNFWLEWTRYTDFEVLPNPEIITGQQGQSFFITSDSDIDPTTRTSPPHSFSFQGFPRISSPRATVLFRWYEVPYSYVTSENSYLVNLIGRVNQTDFMGWTKGTLLYEGLKGRRYVPANPQPNADAESGRQSTAKLCDLEMTWTLCKRTQDDVPDLSGFNASWVFAGHNLLPWFGNRQFYAGIYPRQGEGGVRNDKSHWRPTYDSAEFRLLFQNPDGE